MIISSVNHSFKKKSLLNDFKIGLILAIKQIDICHFGREIDKFVKIE
jgi:hypothetical protein